jgi:hypothetical protein
MEKAIHPQHVRVGKNAGDAALIVDKFGVTVPTYGFLPWHWLERVEAFDIEGKPALVIGWDHTPQLLARFPDIKARMMMFEDGLIGGWPGNTASTSDQIVYRPLMELYQAIEAYAREQLPAKPERD